ncbi:hypothetical protein [Streptosporangium sp. NPDC051022]|uniref:hypothetical protein n=1 Tax=Streptosporangium sp. NPDC051022 TaxID=3155752 RepID=UPI00341F010E
METVLTLLLIRFGVIVGALVVLTLVVFAVVVALRRRGGLGRARRYAEPAAQAVARYLSDRDAPRSGRGSSRGNPASGAVRMAARYLEEDRRRNGDR